MSLRLGPASSPPDRHTGAAAAEGGAGSRPGQEHGELPPHARPFPGRLHRPAHRHEISVRAGLERWVVRESPGYPRRIARRCCTREGYHLGNAGHSFIVTLGKYFQFGNFQPHRNDSMKKLKVYCSPRCPKLSITGFKVLFL